MHITLRAISLTVLHFCLFAGVGGWESACLQAQSGIRYSEGSLGSMMCVWPATRLLEAPDANAPLITPVLFGERLTLQGQRAYVIKENRTYVQVRNSESEMGWIFDSLLVDEGEVGVITESAAVFLRPKTPATITLDRFEPGDLVIVSATYEGWTKVIGAKKQPSGWVEPDAQVSTEAEDVQLATLWQRSKAESSGARRSQIQGELLEVARMQGSPLMGMMAAQIDLPPSTSPTPQANSRNISGTSSYQRPYQDPELGGQVFPAVPPPVQQEGKAKVVPIPSDPTRSNIYYAYHATLPYGTILRLQIPDNLGFVEVRIVDVLPAQTRGELGLPPDLMQAILGSTMPTTIAYEIIEP